MKLSLYLKYKKLPMGDKGKEITPSELTRLILTNLVAAKYGDKALPRSESRTWARIQDELADDSDAITLDQTQFDWVYDLVDKTDLPQQFSAWLWVVRDYFESAKKENEKGPELSAVK